MKAYLSNPHPGFIIPDRHDMPAEREGLSGRMALDEARAILAETEPAGGYLWRGPDYRNDLTGPGPEFQALAEALGAFVED